VTGSRTWWRSAIVYQVYPRSFSDASGDGIGDLPGITSRVDYLTSLGVDAVWLSPFYPSTWVDGGYDIIDYRDVDPRLGTLSDFDDLVAALHGRDIRIIVDIVPNHTSAEHPWFQKALLAEPGSLERDRYLFRDGRGERGELPPNDWPSHFGSRAWTQAPDGQWYLHMFAPAQPDLNWDNAEVRADFEETLRFWSDRGVDGFRIDVAHGLAKHLDLSIPVTTTEPRRTPLDGSSPLFDRDEVQEIYRSWRAVFDEYDPPRMAVAEAAVPSPRVHRYLTVGRLDQAFNFDFLDASWDPVLFRELIDREHHLAEASSASSTWVLGNHDCVRVASRWGLPAWADVKSWLLRDGQPAADPALGLARSKAAAMLLMALPGSYYLYQGDELGLFEVPDIPPDRLLDPIWHRSGRSEKGRDGCRVPLPWSESGPSYGFGSSDSYLPQPAWFGPLSVERQVADPESTLSFFRELIRVRRLLSPATGIEWRSHVGDAALCFRSTAEWTTLVNFGSDPVALPAGRVLVTSAPLTPEGRLPGNSAAWLGTAEGATVTDRGR